MRFWDSSAVVPLVADQRASERMRALYQRDPRMAVWWGTFVECGAAVARLERMEKLTPDESTRAVHAPDDLARGWLEVESFGLVREAARRIVRAHPLRAADALQLAAAGVAAEQRPATLEFICLDERLRRPPSARAFRSSGGSDVEGAVLDADGYPLR